MKYIKTIQCLIVPEVIISSKKMSLWTTPAGVITQFSVRLKLIWGVTVNKDVIINSSIVEILSLCYDT